MTKKVLVTIVLLALGALSLAFGKSLARQAPRPGCFQKDYFANKHPFAATLSPARAGCVKAIPNNDAAAQGPDPRAPYLFM